jgi:hypothetical protein
MPTALERAAQQEARALARAGLTPDGTPAAKSSFAANEDDQQEQQEQQDDQQQDDNRGADPDAALLREQIDKLQADLAAANNRAAPEQRRAAEMQELWQAAERNRIEAERRAQEQIDALQAQLDAARPAFDLKTVMSEDELSAFDESTLNAIVKISEGIAKAYVPKVDARSETLKVLQERDAEKVERHRKMVLTDPTRGLHQLAQLSYDPAFQAWSQEDDNDMESVVTSLLNAKSTEEVDRFAKIVARRIAKFKERTSPPTDMKTSLGNGMRRSGKPRMTEAEVKTQLAEATRLSRSRNTADRAKAQQILNDLK